MKYLKFTYVDSATGISVASDPSMHGQKFPEVAGLAFVWARESAYPTAVPELFGTCPDDSDTQIDGVLGIYSQADFEQMQADEIDTHKPKVLTMRQARLALLNAGLLATVSDSIANMPGAEGDAARIEWEFAQEVRRDNPLFGSMATVLGLTDEQIDALFVTGVGL